MYENPYNSFNMKVTNNEGRSYQVRNRGSTKAKFISNDFVKVVDEAIGSLNEGRGKVFGKEKVLLDVHNSKMNSIDAPLKIRSNTILEGPCRILAASGFNSNVSAGMIEAYDDTDCYNIWIRDLEINGNRTNNTIGHGIYFVADCNSYRNMDILTLNLDRVRVYNCDETGVSIYGPGEYGALLMSNCMFKYNDEAGLYMNQFYDAHFNNMYLGGPPNLELYACGDFFFNNIYLGGSWTNHDNCNITLGADVHFNNFICDESYNHGFNLDRANGCSFNNGRITDVSLQTNNTYDAIRLGGSTQHTRISNMVFYSTPSKTSFPKYCIQETDTANYNIFWGLDMRMYGTAGLKKIGAQSKYDSGTIIGTIV